MSTLRCVEEGEKFSSGQLREDETLRDRGTTTNPLPCAQGQRDNTDPLPSGDGDRDCHPKWEIFTSLSSPPLLWAPTPSLWGCSPSGMWGLSSKPPEIYTKTAQSRVFQGVSSSHRWEHHSQPFPEPELGR